MLPLLAVTVPIRSKPIFSPKSSELTFVSQTLTMAPHRLQIAVAGLGRMGARHALNVLNKSPRAELVAAFSPDQKEL
jgi:hypothetical protein